MKSLRRRLTSWLIVGAGLLLAVGGVALNQVISSRLQRDFDATLTSKARALATLTEQQGDRIMIEFTGEIMPLLQAAEGVDYYQLWAADGSVLERSRSLGKRDLPHSGGPLEQPLYRDLTLPDGRHGREVEITFSPRYEEDEEGWPESAEEARQRSPRRGLRAVVAVARGREQLNAFLASLRVTLFLFGLGLLAGLSLLVKQGLKASFAPLEELGRELSSRDADSLGEPLTSPDAPAELAPLIFHFNSLLGRIRRSFEREREFSSSLAHELRTPLAELRALAEVALRWPEDSSRHLDNFEEVREIALQMERIVVNLLVLARCDGQQQAILRSEVRLRELVRSCWNGLRREADERGAVLDLDIPETLAMVTDREKLSLILSNLLSNAVAYGPAGGAVTCSAVAAGGKLTLQVSNATTALLPEDLPRIFDRFWRKDPARSGGQHAGLGLTLVSALCDLLGIAVEARLDGGLFMITLRSPLEPALEGEGQPASEEPGPRLLRTGSG